MPNAHAGACRQTIRWSPLARVRTQLGPPCEGGGDDDRSEVVGGELVVSGSDAAEVFEASEHAPDAVALAIDPRVVRDRWLATGARRDNGENTSLGQELAKGVGVVGLVGDQPPQGPGKGDQTWRHGDIVQIARCQQEEPWSAALVGQRVDRRGPAAAGAPDGFVEGPPFPPAADRCALM